MEYPLKEKIGNPDLLVGREKEFKNFGLWLANIPGELSKSRVILARRKSGKTAFVQRIFNQLWNEHGAVIPFYYYAYENKQWYPIFAIDYYRTFASQYISFLERDARLVRELLTLDEIKAYGQSHNIDTLVRDVDLLQQEMGHGHDLMWKTAYEAPHRFASVYDQRFLVIIDEFQYLSKFIYRDEYCQGQPDDTIPGSYHHIVESKVAPMLVTGSYISWLLEIASKYLEAGRLKQFYMTPYLTEEEGLEAVYTYAEIYREPITNETAVLINQLCMADPFFISCIIQSGYDGRDLTTEHGVINTVNYEITYRKSEMSMTWGEYIELTLQKINDRHAKNMLLHLSKYNDRCWTPRQLKEALSLDMEVSEIKKRLHLLVEADVIEWGSSDVDFQGLHDGTLNLILRNRFEKEISTFEIMTDLREDFQAQIDALKKDKNKLRGMLNNLVGKFAEYQLATKFRSLKRFALSDHFEGVTDSTELNIMDVRLRVVWQRADGKSHEFDVVARSSCGRVVVVEVRKTQNKMDIQQVTDFHDKITAYREQFPEQVVLAAFLSLGGFTAEARSFCQAHGIGMAERIDFGF